MSTDKRDRRSTEFFDDAPSDANQLKPRFEFNKGTGTKLRDFPGWVAGNRSAAADALESALEPLHRAIFGRPGKAGERRAALADYQGFPEEQKTIMKSKLVTWKKDQLKDLVQSLKSGIQISVPVGDLADAVLKFLEAPAFKGGQKASTPKPKPEPKKPEKAARVEEPKKAEAPAAKKARTEPAKPSKVTEVAQKQTSNETSKSLAVRVEVYRRVLEMTAAERDALSLKGLRQAIGTDLGFNEDIMRDLANIVKDTAISCVHALKAEGDRRAALGTPAAAPANQDAPAAPSAPQSPHKAPGSASPKKALVDEETA